MKLIYKITAIALVVVMSASCGDFFELDLQDNPNEVTPDKAGADFVFNSVQLNALGSWLSMHNIADGLVRYTTTGAFTYTEALPATTGDGLWFNAYSNLFPDVQALEVLAEGRDGLEVYVATAQILKAMVMIGLVDNYGDVPYSEALQGTDIISPNVDSGADVYAAAEAILDGAIATLSATDDSAPSDDMIYNGDIDAWITAANTMKLKIGVNTRLIGGGSKITAVVSGGNFIDQASEDFIFRTSTERNQPNSRHPFYNNHYENNDGTYMGNYFMWLLVRGEKLERDPRARYYFYRQVDDSYGQDVNVYSCIFSDLPDPAETPQWYLDVDPEMPYCVASEDGYYGRDHANGSGIPPDGPIRTVYGLYPGGGKFDNNSYDGVQNSGTDGSLGEGIAPLMTSYMVDFWRAEAAAAGSTGEDARALLESGIRGSIDLVRGFEGRIPASDLAFVIGKDVATGEEITAETLLMTDDQVEAYVTKVMAEYDAASDKLDVVMTQMFIAFYGNAYEFFNAYRRTGRPANMQPGIDQGVGAFPRSLLYAAVNVNLNSSIDQKSDLQQLVFWDDGSANVR